MKKITKRGLSLLLVTVLSLSVNLAFATVQCEQRINESQALRSVEIRDAGEKQKALIVKRQMIVLYMIAMANVCWVAGRNMEYWNPRYGVVFKKGETYFGIPYSQYLRNTSLETFKRLIKNGKYNGTSGFNHTSPEGSDCSSAVSMAWQQINPDIPYLSTYEMLPTANNPYIVKVGNYEVSEGATTSTEIINANTKEDIYESYSKLQPGDAVVSRSRGGGHVILVREVDVKNQVIIGIDQEGVDENGILKGKNGKSSWKDDRRLPFSELYSKDYIPITIKELAEKD